MNRPAPLATLLFRSIPCLPICAAAWSAPSAASSAQVFIDTTSYRLVSVVRVNHFELEYTYTAQAVNVGDAPASECVATVASCSHSTRIIDGSLHFTEVPARGRATSDDTFRFRRHKRHAFQPIALTWRVRCSGTPANTPPVANAGADQTAFTGATVMLNGSGSSDADGDSLAFAWAITQRPPGSAAVLSDASAVMPTFVADVDGQYQIRLIVNDGRVNSAPDTVSVNTTPSNTPPVANAGPDRQAFVGDLVTLDGTASTDVDGDPLVFSWALLSRPDGSTAELAGAGSAQPTFTPDVPGDYELGLTVSDGRGGADSDDVIVTTEVQ